MNEEQHDVQTPDFSGEPMKMPENTSIRPDDAPAKSAVNLPILVVLAVLLVGILGGLYYWFSVLSATPEPATVPVERPTAEENNEPESTTAEAQTETMQATSPSDELSAIEADLESTDLDSLDAELQAMEAELDASAQ